MVAEKVFSFISSSYLDFSELGKRSPNLAKLDSRLILSNLPRFSQLTT